MPHHEPGTRVFAARNANQETVFLFGCGVYVGNRPRPGSENPTDEDLEGLVAMISLMDERPPDTAVAIERLVAAGEMTAEEGAAAVERDRAYQAEQRARPVEERARETWDQGNANPCIELDDGGTVWGYMCWWGPEERLGEFVGGREIQIVAPPVS